jgi:hypothetical protein
LNNDSLPYGRAVEANEVVAAAHAVPVNAVAEDAVKVLPADVEGVRTEDVAEPLAESVVEAVAHRRLMLPTRMRSPPSVNTNDLAGNIACED